ncbi:MAG: hypothetical protein MJH10_03755, partial [Epibacterium sp.]|nr:hypothetical protein [Epibacterium sp.]
QDDFAQKMTPLEVVHAMHSALNRPENRNPQENLQQSPKNCYRFSWDKMRRRKYDRTERF